MRRTGWRNALSGLRRSSDRSHEINIWSELNVGLKLRKAEEGYLENKLPPRKAQAGDSDNGLPREKPGKTEQSRGRRNKHPLSPAGIIFPAVYLQ